MKLPDRLSIVFPVGLLVVSFSVFSLLILIPYFSKEASAIPETATIYYPATSGFESTTPTPTQIHQVGVLASVAESLASAPSANVPYLPIATPTQQAKELPHFYTELTTKGLLANISDSSFTLVWLTEAPQPTLLQVGSVPAQLSRKISDERKITNATYLHYATAKNLSPENTYYYVGASPVSSSILLPKTLIEQPATLKTSGSILDASNKGECLVIAHIANSTGTSSTLATITNSGVWSLSLEFARNTTLSGYFSPVSIDNVTFDAFCVASGKVIHAGTTSASIKEATERSIVIPVTRIIID